MVWGSRVGAGSLSVCAHATEGGIVGRKLLGLGVHVLAGQLMLLMNLLVVSNWHSIEKGLLECNRVEESALRVLLRDHR